MNKPCTWSFNPLDLDGHPVPYTPSTPQSPEDRRLAAAIHRELRESAGLAHGEMQGWFDGTAVWRYQDQRLQVWTLTDPAFSAVVSVIRNLVDTRCAQADVR